VRSRRRSAPDAIRERAGCRVAQQFLGLGPIREVAALVSGSATRSGKATRAARTSGTDGTMVAVNTTSDHSETRCQNAARLTQKMRAALVEASRNPLRRLHDDLEGKPAWPAHPATLRALEARGLVEKTRRRTRKGWWLDEWSITDNGREALVPASLVRADRPVYMAHPSRTTGDYTSDPSRTFDRLEVMDVGLLGAQWIDDSALRYAASEDRRARARRLSRTVRRD
jgi:DNA-binding PadR family transcriptional regulator